MFAPKWKLAQEHDGREGERNKSNGKNSVGKCENGLPLALSDELDFIALGLGRQTDGGHELLLLASDLLLLDLDLLPALDDRDLHLFGADLLADLGRLQLVSQLSFGFLFHRKRKWKVSLVTQ